MKKLIGVIAILLTLLVCIIYRHLTSQRAKDKPDMVYVPEPLRGGLFLTSLLLQ
jgi:hypothetical protein